MTAHTDSVLRGPIPWPSPPISIAPALPAFPYTCSFPLVPRNVHLLHFRRGKNSNSTEVFVTKKLVTIGTPPLSASVSLFLPDRSALDVDLLRPSSYHSPAVKLSPEASATTLPLRFCSQFPPIFAPLPAGLGVLMRHLRHNLASTVSSLSFPSAATSGSTTICLLCTDPGYGILLEGGEKIV